MFGKIGSDANSFNDLRLEDLGWRVFLRKSLCCPKEIENILMENNWNSPFYTGPMFVATTTLKLLWSASANIQQKVSYVETIGAKFFSWIENIQKIFVHLRNKFLENKISGNLTFLR